MSSIEMKRLALVVDDDSVIRKFIRDVLELEGFLVLEATDGRKGAQLVRENPQLALIVTDILMPDEDGIDFILQVSKIHEGTVQRPKILAISGGGVFAGPALYLNNAHFLGADKALPKPFTDTKLIEVLSELGFHHQSA